MTRSSQPPRLRLWSSTQRRVLIAFVLVTSVVLLVRQYFRSTYIPERQPSSGLRAGELQDKLDPNVAGWEALAEIPNLGESRAKQIVAYREEFYRTRPGRMPFENPDDLLKVKGMGVSTVESIESHLEFPTTNPASKSP